MNRNHLGGSSSSREANIVKTLNYSREDFFMNKENEKSLQNMKMENLSITGSKKSALKMKNSRKIDNVLFPSFTVKTPNESRGSTKARKEIISPMNFSSELTEPESPKLTLNLRLQNHPRSKPLESYEEHTLRMIKDDIKTVENSLRNSHKNFAFPFLSYDARDYALISPFKNSNQIIFNFFHKPNKIVDLSNTVFKKSLLMGQEFSHFTGSESPVPFLNFYFNYEGFDTFQFSFGYSDIHFSDEYVESITDNLIKRIESLL